MRKASAFRISWPYHLYRSSLRESTGLLLRSPQIYLSIGEKLYTCPSNTSTVDNHCRGSSSDHYAPKPLIVHKCCNQDLHTLCSPSGSKGPAPANGAIKLYESTSQGLDGYLQRRIRSLFRHYSCMPASHSRAQERASVYENGPVGDVSKMTGPRNSSTLFFFGNSNSGDECGFVTKGKNPWTPSEIPKVQGLLAALATVKDRESSKPLLPDNRNPMSGAGNWNCYSVSLGFCSSPGSPGLSLRVSGRGGVCNAPSVLNLRSYSAGAVPPTSRETPSEPLAREYSQRAVVTALWCNFLVFALKLGVWTMTSSHVMLAEAIHSLADLANQGLLAYGLMSSKRAPDAMHPYGYTKERFVWSLISAVGIFCLGAGATIIHGLQNLFSAQPLENIYLAALVIGGSVVMEGASLLVAISCVRNGAKAEGMTIRDYLWRGHDPTSVAVMMEDGAAVTGLGIAALALAAAHYTGNPMWDPIGSIIVGNLLGVVAIFLIQRNRHALLGRSMDDKDMMRVITLLSKDPVVDAIYDCKSEVIGPSAYRFKAEIDFNGEVIVQNFLRRAGRGNWHKEFTEAASSTEPGQLDRAMAAYGEEIVSALGSEVDRLEKEIQKIVPGIRHVDIEAHNPQGPAPREKLYIY